MVNAFLDSRRIVTSLMHVLPPTEWEAGLLGNYPALVAFLLVDIKMARKVGAIMAHQPPLKYVFYIAATPEKVWEGFVSQETNRIIFAGAELQADF